MTTAAVLAQLGSTLIGCVIGVWIGQWTWGLNQARRKRNEAKRLIARQLGGTEVDETKPHRRTIIRKH